MSQRVLLLVTDLQIGGTPTVVRELVLRLADDPTHVEVACLAPWGPVADQISAAGIGVTALDATRPWHLPRTVRRLRTLLVDRQIDTLVSFLIHANFVATLAVQPLKQVRLIQSIQTTQPSPAWHWWLQGRIHLAAQTLLVPSKAIAAAATRRSGIPPDRITVIPNAVEPSDFPVVPVFQRSPVRVGFLGRIDPIKRLDIALQAIAQLPDMALEIFGDGPERAALQQRYRHLPNVTWHGAVASPQAALPQMDMMILPSIGEGFGLVLIEAMAAGVPVIASAAGAIPQIITHGQTGLLIPTGRNEPDQFADAMRRLAAEPSLRDGLIARAREHVLAHFTWSATLPQYRTLLSAAGGQP